MGKQKALSAQDIRDASIPRRPVKVEDWGGIVYVRSLPHKKARDIWEGGDADSSTVMTERLPEILHLGVVDEDGKSLFTDVGEVEELLDSDVFTLRAVQTLVQEILGQSAITEDGRDELEGN